MQTKGQCNYGGVRLKVLFLAENLTYGGSPRRFIDLANELSERNMDVTFFIFNGDINLRDKIYSDIEIEIQKYDTKQRSWLYRNVINRVKSISRINKFLSRNNFDLIISFDDMVNISLILSKARFKSKILISERSDPYYNKNYLKIIKRILYRYVDGIVFQTVGAQTFFNKIISDKSAVIPNPIPSSLNYAPYTGIREQTIVSVARLWIFQKRQDLLIDAFSIVVKKHPEYRLIIFGDGPDENILRDQVCKLNLQNKVEFKGVSTNVFEDIKKSSVFVLTSDFEGIPNALIEAMMIGLPIVTTDCSPGGARFLIKNNKNGLIVKRSDAEEIANAINFMIENPEKSQEMANEAMNVSDLLNKDAIYDKWEDYIINEVLSS